jgi:hypothetical protein
MALLKKKDIVHKTFVTASKEPQGKIKAALEIVKLMYPGAKWLELVESVSNQVTAAREARGVGERPVLYSYNPDQSTLEPIRH